MTVYIGKRGLAAIMDGTIVTLGVALVSAIGVLLAYLAFADWRWEGQVAQTFLAAIYYTVGNSRLTGGSTLGKRLFGLKTVDSELRPILVSPAFQRALVVMFLAILFLPVQWIVDLTLALTPIDKQIIAAALSVAAGVLLPISVILGHGRGLHDLAVGTYVIDRDGGPEGMSSRNTSIWFLTGRSFVLSLAATVLVSALVVTHWREILTPDGSFFRFLLRSVSITEAHLGQDITNSVESISDAVPMVLDSAWIRSGVDPLPTFLSQNGQTAESLNERAARGRWLTIALTLAPEFSRSREIRRSMADVGARYVADRYETGNLFVLVRTAASTRFGIIGIALQQDFVVQFMDPNSWLVLRPEKSRRLEVGLSMISQR